VWCQFIRILLPHLSLHEEEVLFDMLDISGDKLIGPHEFIKLNDLMYLYNNSPVEADIASFSLNEPTRHPNLIRLELQKFASSKKFERFILGCILANSLVLAMHIKEQSDFNDALFYINTIFGIIFAVELLIRTAAWGFRMLWIDWQKCLDSGVIVFSLVASVWVLATHTTGAALIGCRADLKKVQSILIFRMFALFQPWVDGRGSTRIQLVFSTLVSTLPTTIGLLSTLVLIMYAYAIVGMESFNTSLDPHDYAGGGAQAQPVENFTDFEHTFILLFQLLMVNNWNTLLTNCMTSLLPERGEFLAVGGPTLYFMSFIMVVVVVVSDVISAVFLIVFHLTEERVEKSAMKGYSLADANGVGDRAQQIAAQFGAGDRAGRAWAQGIERLMMEAIIEEELEEVHRTELDALVKQWRQENAMPSLSPHAPLLQPGSVEDFLSGRDHLVETVRRVLGDDEDGHAPAVDDERAQYIQAAHMYLYAEELRAPRQFYDIEL